MSDIPETAVKAAAEVLTHRDWRRRAPWDEGYTLSRHADSPEDEVNQIAVAIAYELGRARKALEAAMPHLRQQVAEEIAREHERLRKEWSAMDNQNRPTDFQEQTLLGMEHAAHIAAGTYQAKENQ